MNKKDKIITLENLGLLFLIVFTSTVFILGLFYKSFQLIYEFNNGWMWLSILLLLSMIFVNNRTSEYKGELSN